MDIGEKIKKNKVFGCFDLIRGTTVYKNVYILYLVLDVNIHNMKQFLLFKALYK